jgi:AraC-like DNA-binding protein
MKIVAATNELNHPYAPQLVIRESSLAPGAEWVPPGLGWSLVQIASGTGYWLQGQSRTELESGTLLLVAGEMRGCVLASCLSDLRLRFFTVIPERLAGLITDGELDFLNQTAASRELACQILPREHPVAMRWVELCNRPHPTGLLRRLLLLQLLIEAFGREVAAAADSAHPHTDVKERLRVFLQATPPAALLDISFAELAHMTHCTPRHLSRVFFDVAGMSFRDKRAEIRLARARELLATSQSKVVDVAFKSGYKSLSLFNRMFTRRFGVSPGRWRQKNGASKDPAGSSKTRVAVTLSRSRDF